MKTLTAMVVVLFAGLVAACGASDSVDVDHGDSQDRLSDCLGNPCAEIVCDGDDDTATECVCSALPNGWSCNDPFRGACLEGRCVYGE